jgi:hypothetical protein
MAQVDVQIGPPPVRVEPEPRPGVVIEEERRRPGVVTEGPEGRPRDHDALAKRNAQWCDSDGKGAGVHPLRCRRSRHREPLRHVMGAPETSLRTLGSYVSGKPMGLVA